MLVAGEVDDVVVLKFVNNVVVVWGLFVVEIVAVIGLVGVVVSRKHELLISIRPICSSCAKFAAKK